MSSQSRRSFLASLGAAVGLVGCRTPAADASRADTGARTGARSGGRTDAASAPPPRPLGIQLYTVREAMRRDVAGTLASLAAIGYREVEFAGYFGVAPAELRAMLARVGLTSPAAHVPYDRIADGWARTLDEAAAVGHRWVVIPWLPVEARRTADDWRRVAERLSGAAVAAQAAGLRLGYHNHDFELKPVDGVVPLDILLSETPRDRVDFELDVYWVVRGGGDPLDFLARHGGRFPMLHVKDSAGAPAHAQVDVGAGVIDYGRVIATATAQGARHLFVEHDQPADPMAFARASHAHLAALLR